MRKIHSKKSFLLLCATLLLILSACSPGGAGTQESRSPTATPQATPRPTATEPAGAEILFINSSGVPVCEISLALAGSLIWAAPQVAQAIPSGSNYTLNKIPAGKYDTKVNDCGGNVVSWTLNSEIEDGAKLTYEILSPPDYLLIENNSSLSMCELYMRSAAMPSYSRNILGRQQQLNPGESFYVNLAAGSWDFRFVACGGATLEVPNYIIQGKSVYVITD
jgi:hypothetical protein